MDSSQLEIFNGWWKDRLLLMVGQHHDERIRYGSEAKAKRQSAIEDAQVELERLRNRALDPAAVHREVRKINEDRDATLQSINRQYDERMRIVEESQRKEQENHKKAYEEALADRSFMDSTLPVHSSAITTTTYRRQRSSNLPRHDFNFPTTSRSIFWSSQRPDTSF